MATEIAVVGPVPITVDDVLEAAASAQTGYVAVELRDGELTVLVDEHGEHVLTLFESKQIVVPDDVTLVLAGPVPPGAVAWTSITVPFGRSTGSQIAERVAEATGSTAAVIS